MLHQNNRGMQNAADARRLRHRDEIPCLIEEPEEGLRA